MSSVSNGSATPAPEFPAETQRPRRMRLVKAMAALGRAKEVRSVQATEAPRARSRKLSHADELRLEILKRRLAGQGIRVRKGDLLGAALKVLAALDDASLRGAVAALDEAVPSPQDLPS